MAKGCCSNASVDSSNSLSLSAKKQKEKLFFAGKKKKFPFSMKLCLIPNKREWRK